MAAYSENYLNSLGKHLGEYSHSWSGKNLAPTALQGVIADLAADIPDLQAPLREALPTSRPTTRNSWKTSYWQLG